MEQNNILRMKELIIKLLEASRAYYAEDREIMSNYEYDRLYDELEALEKETGTVLADSPSIHVGYEVLSELPRKTMIRRCFLWIKQRVRKRCVAGLMAMRDCFLGNWTA